MINKSKLLAKKLGLSFTDFQLFILALSHRSSGAKNNERLEYLGDSILGFVIAEKLYEMFPTANEGDLSRLRANLVNQTSLADLAREHKIGDYLILGSGELKSEGYKRDSILSDALEAIMGALVKDQGMLVCRQWILNLFTKKLAGLDLQKSQKDPKTQLQEFLQARKTDLPVYELIKTKGASHAQTFSIKCSTVLFNESCVSTGVSRKRAEQGAAEKMLQIINKHQL